MADLHNNCWNHVEMVPQDNIGIDLPYDEITRPDLGDIVYGVAANEGFNSRLGYYGKVRERVFVEAPEDRLSDEAIYAPKEEAEEDAPVEEPIEGPVEGEEEQTPEENGEEEVPAEGEEEENPETPEGN